MSTKVHASSEFVCTYCKKLATTSDHVPPRLLADAFRAGVGAPDVEYLFEMELTRMNQKIHLPHVYPQYLGEILGTVTPNPCLFPRLSIGSTEEFGKVMRLVMNDLLNAAGVEGIEGEFSIVSTAQPAEG